MQAPSPSWKSHYGFLAATIGAAVGLGNIWRFPYVTGEYGGAVFVLVYLLCAVGLGWPIMVSEFLMGRRTKSDAYGAFKTLAQEAGRRKAWLLGGLLPVISSVVILSYYSVVGGWTIDYFVKSITGQIDEDTLLEAGKNKIARTSLFLSPSDNDQWYRDFFQKFQKTFSSEDIAAWNFWNENRNLGDGTQKLKPWKPLSWPISTVLASPPLQNISIDATNRIPDIANNPMLSRIQIAIGLTEAQGKIHNPSYDQIPAFIRLLLVSGTKLREGQGPPSNQELHAHILAFNSILWQIANGDDLAINTQSLKAQTHDSIPHHAASLWLRNSGAEISFSSLTSRWISQSVWHLVFIGLSMLILAMGITRGVEALNKWMVPSFVGILLLLLIYVFFEANPAAAIAYLFNPDLSKLSDETVSRALGQAFFSLSIGIGTLIAYGSYLSQKTTLPTAATTVVAADTGIALLAGVVIFSVVLSFGGEPGHGSGLMFVSIPTILADMPFGIIAGPLFFLLLIFASFTSSLGLLEVPVLFLQRRFNLSRKNATLIGSIPIVIGGIFCTIPGYGVFEALVVIADVFTLPLTAVMISLFVGWRLLQPIIMSELTGSLEGTRRFYQLLIRYVTPIITAGVLIHSISTWLKGLF